MSSARRDLEDQVVDLSHRLHARGWVANHDGNVTARLGGGHFLITPTSYSKAAVTRDLLLVVDERGQIVSGKTKPFSELDLHLFVYRERSDVMAVLHAHPPTATGFAVAGIEVRTTLLAEPVVSLGRTIPLIPYAAPKTPEWTSLMKPALDDADALILEHHGVLTCGPDLETAYLRMELVEHLAKIQLVAAKAGAVREIPANDIDKLLAARTKAGLGKAARSGSAPSERIKTLVTEELRKVVGASCR
jgi:L-fuculose-phosphate aldolase